MILTRLRNARLWVIIASTYYLFKALLIIYPTFEERNETTKGVIIFNSMIQMVIIAGTLWTYKYHLLPFQWILYL